MTKPTLFIDGEAGTTGLEIRKRLEGRADIEIISIDADKRKDAAERKRLLNGCDLAVLCLPDDAAREAVGLIDNPNVRVLDASTAYRVAPGWVYGFGELTPDQEDNIRKSKRVSNPGCYPTGAVAMLRPLVDAGIIPHSYGITINAVSGYSGGGKELIAVCESADGGEKAAAYCLYGIDQKHKHLPEMRMHSGLTQDPIFLPVYSGAFYRGMLVTIALRMKDLNALTGKTANAETVWEMLANRYHGKNHVIVEPLQKNLEKGYVLTPYAKDGNNQLQLRVFTNEEKEIVVLTSSLDNLGKGAAGGAIQNIEFMLGLA